MDDYPFPEPFGPVYARPAGADCPDCECCTRALCETARGELMQSCQMISNAPELVRGCPCPTKPGQVRCRECHGAGGRHLTVHDRIGGPGQPCSRAPKRECDHEAACVACGRCPACECECTAEGLGRALTEAAA